MSTESNSTTEKKQFKASDIVAKLDSGMSREEIRVELGLTKAEATRLFANPTLKGRKKKIATKRNDPFELIEDVPVPEKKAKVTKTAEATEATGTASETTATASTEAIPEVKEEETKETEEDVY